MQNVKGAPYEVEESVLERTHNLSRRVAALRQSGALSPEVLGRLRRFFKIKNIYHSNAIEGNVLDVGETRMVVEQGLTITGKPLKDQAEAKNLSEAIDFLEELATDGSRPITGADIRQIHYLVLKEVRDSDAGKYRTVPVEIGGSEYKPPGPEVIAAQMDEFSMWLASASIEASSSDESALVVASVAHTWFVTIHPFIDGNGRCARLLMNLILMRAGYPIAIITKADRSRYYDALEISQSSDLTAMVALVAECLEESLEEYEVAANEQRENEEWARSIVSRFEKGEKVRASNQYEVWRSAMDLLKSVFRQTSELVGTGLLADVWFKDFGHLELEKYLALKVNASAKKTWYFRVDFRSGDKSARYLFFFGSPSYSIKQQCDVTLHLAREEPAGSFNYERLELITSPNVPSLLEIGYSPATENFLGRQRGGMVKKGKIETLCRQFFEDVVQRHFSG